MILNRSLLNNCDFLGYKSSKAFLFYRKKKYLYTKVNNFFRASLSKNYTKHFTQKKNNVIKTYKSFYNLSKYKHLNKDGSFFFFFENTNFLLKNKINLKCNIIFGPGLTHNKYKKINKFFINVL